MCLQVYNLFLLVFMLQVCLISMTYYPPVRFFQRENKLLTGIIKQEMALRKNTSPAWSNCVSSGKCLKQKANDFIENRNPFERRNSILLGHRLYDLREVLRRAFHLIVALKHRSERSSNSLNSFMPTWKEQRKPKSFIKRLYTCPFLNRVGFPPSICTIRKGHRNNLRRQPSPVPSSPPTRRIFTGSGRWLPDSWPVLHLIGGALGKRYGLKDPTDFRSK